MPHDFSIDKFSDDEACDKAVEQLERMVALGDQAKAALEAIRTRGFYEGKAPVAGPEAPQWGEGRGQIGHSVRFAVLQKRVPFSRADLPPLDNLQLVFKDANMDAKYSGHPCVEIPLYCSGQVARQIDHVGGLEFFEQEEKLGDIRINKNHISFIEVSNRKTVQIFQDLTKGSLVLSIEPAMVFAERLAHMMVREGLDMSAATTQGAEFVQMAARTLDLQKNAPQWFIDDGVVQRMYLEIHRYVNVLQVMEA